MRSPIQAQEATPAEEAWENTPCGLLKLDRSLNIIQINDTLLQWLGRTRDDLTYFARDGHIAFADLAGIVNRQWLDALHGHLDALSPQAPPSATELRLVNGEGESFLCEFTSSGVFDAQGQLRHTQTCVTNITNRRRTESSLKSRLALVQRLADLLPTRIAYFDTQLVCQFANAAYAREFGQTEDGMCGLHISEIVSASLLSEILPKIAKVLSGEPVRFEAERATADGQRGFYEAHYLPDIDGQQVVGYCAQLIDITDRRQTEDFVFNANLDLEERVAQRTAELFLSEQRYRLMSEAIREYGVFFLDLAGTITEWTDSAQRLHGFTRASVAGHGLPLLLQDTPDGAQAADSTETTDANSLLERCIGSGHADHEGWCARADGSRFWGRFTLTALRNTQDELQGVSCIVRDLSDAKRLSDLSQQTNRQLSSTVARQSSALALLNKDLEVFSYAIAHDLRSPLRHIDQFVKLALEQIADEDAQPLGALISRISMSTRRLGGMIEGLLAYTQLGKSEVSSSPIPLSALVQGIAGHLRAETTDRRIEWVIDPQLPTITGDPILLGEALGKLLDNAVKFTRRNPQARIEVGLKSVLGQRAVIFIKDNGVGFDLKRAKNLYLMFQRQHHSMDFEGLGTGLALAHRIIERHGGSLWCDTAPDKGCRFFLELPLQSRAPVALDIAA